jgi:molecular chaperone HtpG
MSFGDEPLFWIHLNVDYPFHLTGILYFPRIKSNLDLQRNKIQLYSNQVYVTDSVEGIVPEFLTLLHGVIDSPDIPLNVSRSYLQSDQNVKKISNHITKKVADKLEELFKKERSQFEEKWDSLKLFIEYGMLSEDKFYDRAIKFALVKNSEQKFFTLEEYKELTKGSQTDKQGDLIWLYASDLQEQYSSIEAAREKGYDVLLMNGQLDVHWMGLLEQKLEKTRFVRVDSDIIEHIIEKDERSALELSEKQKESLTEVVKAQLPVIEKSEFSVDFKALGENSKPVQITQNEFSRRMKEMAAMQQQMAFYGEMPDSYQLVLNADHPYIKELITQSESKEKEELMASVTADAKLKQMIDLALLAGGLLKGEALNNFVKRSFEMI